MIKRETRLRVADNSGAKLVCCIGIPGGTRKKSATVGEKITVAVKQATPRSNVKKKQVVTAVIVRAAKEIARKDGTYIRFGDNAVVIVDKNGDPFGTRVLGPIAREVREKYPKIVSLATEIY